MATKLTQKQVNYVIRAMKRGEHATDVAMHLGVSTRHVYSLWAEYRRTGRVRAQGRPGRPRKIPHRRPDKGRAGRT